MLIRVCEFEVQLWPGIVYCQSIIYHAPLIMHKFFRKSVCQTQAQTQQSCESLRTRIDLVFPLSKEVTTGRNGNKTKVESVQLRKPPTEPRVLRKVCVVVVGGGGWCWVVLGLVGV